jgi:hypothetical protein
MPCIDGLSIYDSAMFYISDVKLACNWRRSERSIGDRGQICEKTSDQSQEESLSAVGFQIAEREINEKAAFGNYGRLKILPIMNSTKWFSISQFKCIICNK